MWRIASRSLVELLGLKQYDILLVKFLVLQNNPKIPPKSRSRIHLVQSLHKVEPFACAKTKNWC